MLNNQQNRPSRKELLARLQKKRESLRSGGIGANGIPNNMSQKQYNKLQKEVKQQMKQIKEDPRITDDMLLYHKKCIDELPNFEIPSPLELLNNETKAREQFNSYITNIVKSCAEQKIPKEQFDKFINTTYTQYHIKIFGIDIIPEKLRTFVEKTEEKSN